MSIPDQLRDVIHRILWSDDSQEQGRIFTVIDAARDDTIYPEIVAADAEKTCLLVGEQAHQLAPVAPYLIELDEENPFTRWVLDHGWGKSWGIFVVSTATFLELRHHFRKFLKVADEDGNTLFFRYYDPRVFRIFMPTCTEGQLQTVFGPVDRYFVEGEDDGTIIQYFLRGNNLVRNDIVLSEVTGE